MPDIKSLYELGEMPPLGEVPRQMYASVIRSERYGQPKDAFKVEVIDVPKPGPGQVLVWVMAAGINYNNVWAALGQPVDVIASRRKRDAAEPAFHIGGSDASGVVWAVGPGARARVGDEVVLSCAMWDENAPDIKAGADPITSTSAKIWGYEENWGSFAQFTLVDDYQCHPKPKQLSWEAAAAYMLVGATAYRQLMGWEPHTVKPGDPVLIWGGSGGLGSMAIQIVKAKGGIPVAVVSSKERIEHCLRLGAHGVIDRTDPAFTHWGRLPDTADAESYALWMQGANAFRKKWSEVLGSRQGPRIVLEHPGESTIPTSILVCDNAGMVVICAGTTGYNADVDLRYLWMRQKRLQGSHFANTEQCRALNDMVIAGQVDPALARVFAFDQVGTAHQLLHQNTHPPGNLAIRVNAPD
ncbi:crotonyl-CoA carboxylase/reductase [uncultured Methylibium sp.]|uniref:crotonyl-CoA carboxylase/reductase n=1 Tax=uncultured Methylibium sp. TaxID=381093 RepID=UPI0025E9ED30|nr:crotonyl-CoA carboxylase/reductase [uncultured Methylibium sp.]